ncbi:MAG: YfhO family protein, partial [Bacteroidia bacterium]
RYVNKKDFVNKTKSLVPFEPSVADEFIYSRETSNEPEIGQRALTYRDEALKRKKRVKSGNNAADENKYRFLGLMANTNYRVLNLSTSTFNDAATSFFHKSVGGYSAVKLERYQEMIEFHIQKNMKSVSGMLRGGMTDSIFQAGMQNQYALNMLNTRYIIYNSEANPLVNEAALGNAWFVKEVKRVKNANEEIQAMNAGFDPARTAIVDERFSDQIPAKLSTYTEDNNIRLESYAPNALRYKCAAADKSVVVFSEIYYAKGWKSYLDGKEVPHFRANYILRGMVVPQGDHQIEFKFEPEQLYTTEAISYTASSILIALLLLMVGIELKRRKPSVAK